MACPCSKDVSELQMNLRRNDFHYFFSNILISYKVIRYEYKICSILPISRVKNGCLHAKENQPTSKVSEQVPEHISSVLTPATYSLKKINNNFCNFLQENGENSRVIVNTSIFSFCSTFYHLRWYISLFSWQFLL